MSWFIYIIISLFLVILNTAISPLFGSGPYDILIPFIVYLGIVKPIRYGLFIAILSGVLMDGLSGTPSGLYLFSYLWILIIVKLSGIFLNMESFLQILAVIGGVLLENFLFIITIVFLTPKTQIPEAAFKTLSIQLLWAAFTGIVILSVLKQIDRKKDNWIKKRKEEKRGNGGGLCLIMPKKL